MEIDGNTSKKSDEYLDDNDILPPKESSSEYKDSKKGGFPIVKEKLQSNPDTGDSAASFKELNETYKTKEELRENFKLLRSLEVTRNTLEPLQEYPDGTEYDDVFDNLKVMSTICSTPRKGEAGFETRHNNSFCDDDSNDDSNERVRSYVATNTLNLQQVVEVLKTVASDEDDSRSLVVPEKANVANSEVDDSGEYLDPSAYIKDFSKTKSILNLNNLMDRLLETKEDKAVVRDMAKLYFENLNKCLCGYFSQLKGENSTKMFEEKISLGHLKIVLEGFRDSWMDAVDIMDLKDNPKDTDEDPEETNKNGNAVSEKIPNPSESYNNNSMETRGISMNLSSHSSTKKVDSEKEVFRNKISSRGDNTYLKPKELAKKTTKTNVAKVTTVSLYKTAAIPEKSMQLLDDIFKIFANVMKFAPLNHKPSNKPENSIGELKNFDTKELSVPLYAEECVADEIEDHGDSNNILVCSESECSVKKEESKKPSCNEARTSSFHVYVNDSNEGLEITDKNENPCVGSGRGKSYDDLTVESKELDDEKEIEGSSQTGTSIEDSRKTEGEDNSSYPVSVGNDLKVTLEVQKKGVRTEESNAVFDRKDSYLEESNDDLRKIDGTNATTANVEDDPNLQGTNEEQKKTVYINNYHSSANVDSILEVSIEEQRENDKNEKPIAVINRRDSDPEESIDELKHIDGMETTVTSFVEDDFVPKESNKESEKTVVTDISLCSVNEVPDHEVSIEGKTEANSTEKSNPIFHTKVSYPEESIDELKGTKYCSTKGTTKRLEEEDADLQESNEDHKKTVDSDKCPISGSVDTNLEVSIEEPKESDSAEKPTTILDGRYSDMDRSVDELKQIYRTEATVSSFDKDYFNPDESNEESKQEVHTDISSSSVIANPDLEVSIDGQKGAGSTEKSNPVLEREISYPEESINELKQIDGAKATTVSVEEDPDLQESIKEQKENCSSEKQIAVEDRRDSDPKESIDEPKQYDRTEAAVTSFDDKEDFDPEEFDEKPKKTIVTDISPCFTDDSADDLDVRKKSNPGVSIGEPKQFVAEPTSSIFEEEKCSDPQESNYDPKKTVNPDTCPYSGSDLEVSIVEQKEADITEKPTGEFDREDLDLEEYNEKPKRVPSTEKTTTISDNEVSDHKEPNEEPKKTVDPDTYSYSVRSGSDLEVVIVEQKETDGTKKPTEDFNSKDFLEEQKQSHGTETSPTRSDKDSYFQEPNKGLSVVDVSQHLDVSDFYSNESIEEIKKLDNTELSSCTDEQESEELTNKLAPLKEIEMSLACSEKVCSDMKEGSKEPANKVTKNSDSKDVSPTDLNEKYDLKDMNGKEECSEPSIEEPTKIEGLVDKFACSNTEDSSLMKSHTNVETKEVEDYIPTSKSADYGCEVSIRENNDNGLKMYTAVDDSNPIESVEELKYIDDADEIITCHEDQDSSTAVVDSNPIEFVEELKYIDDADEIVTCNVNKDSSTKDVEEPKEIGDTEVFATVSEKKVCEPQHSNEEASNIEDSEIKSFYMKAIGLKLKDLTEKATQSDDSKPKETEESTKTANTEMISDSSVDKIPIETVLNFNDLTEEATKSDDDSKPKETEDSIKTTTTEKISESSVDKVPIETVVKLNDLTEEATKSDDDFMPKKTEESTKTANTENISKSFVDNDPIETVVKLNDLTEEATKSDDDSKPKETDDSIKTATTEKISESSVDKVPIETIVKLNDLTEEATKSDDVSKPKETEDSIKTPTTENISDSSVDNVSIETVRDPKTPENVYVCSYKADNSSERLVEYPSSSNDLSRPSPVTDESLTNVNPASVWGICDTAKREKIEKAVDKSCPSKGRKVACPGSEENVQEYSLPRSIPHEHLSSDSTFVNDLCRLVFCRKKYPKRKFSALPHSPFSVRMQEDVRIMLFYKEREMYFVAKQHKESAVQMAQKALSHFVRRPFCPKTFLWLLLYICNHFVLLMGEMTVEGIQPLVQILSKCIGDLRALGKFTDETWQDVEVAAKSIAMALKLTVTNDDSA